MVHLPLAVTAGLTLAASVALVATVTVIIPRIFRDHYRHELWRITADLHQRARAGRVPRAAALELLRAIDRHAELVSQLSGSDVLAYRITGRMQTPSRNQVSPFARWESQPRLAPFVRRMHEASAKSLMYGSFSGWLFTLYMRAKIAGAPRRDGRHGARGTAEAGAKRAVRRLEALRPPVRA